MEYNNWLKKELSQIERIRKNMDDQYNTIETPKHISDIQNEVKVDARFSPKAGQTWESYVNEMKIVQEFAQKKNESTHINGVRRAWYTHRSSSSCFMCEDSQLQKILLQAMRYMASQHPEQVF